MIGRIEKDYDLNGYTFLAVDLLDGNEFVGFIGIIQSSFDAFFTPVVKLVDD